MRWCRQRGVAGAHTDVRVNTTNAHAQAPTRWATSNTFHSVHSIVGKNRGALSDGGCPTLRQTETDGIFLFFSRLPRSDSTNEMFHHTNKLITSHKGKKYFNFRFPEPNIQESPSPPFPSPTQPTLTHSLTRGLGSIQTGEVEGGGIHNSTCMHT